jgi:MoxR-like ATPase
MDESIKRLNEKAKRYRELVHTTLAEVKKVIVGQDEVLEKILISLIADGHILVEGVPGLAKTMMIKTLAATIKSKFHRIQFTPDLLPADIIGTKIYNQKTGEFLTKKGPIFANFILADEINRAPPKCQSALLEAMQERQVTIGEQSFRLERPFLVLATMNPLEHEGVYTLPEAQVDRFMFKVLIGYPTKEDEGVIIDRMTSGKDIKVNGVIKPEEIIAIQEFNKNIYADDKIKDYVTEIVQATRNPQMLGVDGLVDYGASPRASIWLILAGKAHALLNGRGYVVPEDIQAVTHEVLRHRILLSYEAEAEEITSDNIIDKIIKKVKVP